MVVSRHAEEDREATSVNPENVELRYLEAKGFEGPGSTEPAAVDFSVAYTLRAGVDLFDLQSTARSV
jgi:hypothetical protein